MIDVLVPVLGRPENAQPLVDSIRANTTIDHRIWFICSPDDNEQQSAAMITDADLVLIAKWAPGPGDFSKKINHAYTASGRIPNQGEFVFMGADDIVFTPGWDTNALRMMRGRIGVVATNDMANRQVMRGEFGTHCLISRDYIDTYGGTFSQQPGVVLHEGYDHNFVDRELCDAARTRKAFAFASKSIVRHRHPLWKTAEWDNTYRKALDKFHDDQKLYAERTRMWKKTTRNRDIVAR